VGFFFFCALGGFSRPSSLSPTTVIGISGHQFAERVAVAARRNR
jgi:hypothetical protein